MVRALKAKPILTNIGSDVNGATKPRDPQAVTTKDDAIDHIRILGIGLELACNGG